MPVPSSRTRTTASPRSIREVGVMWPPAQVNLAALLSRLANTWTTRVLSASRGSDSFARASARVCLVDDHRTAHLHRLQQQGRQLDPLQRSCGSSPDGARDVEQVVEEPLHVQDLPSDDRLVGRPQRALPPALPAR